MPHTDDSAAHAPNWRTVLVVDSVLGLGVSIAGVFLAWAVNMVAGIGVVVIGAGYAALVGARARRWRRLRRDAAGPG